MIDEQLVRLEAAKRGITVSDEELKEAKEASFDYFPKGSPTPSVTPTLVITPEIPAEAFSVVTITPIPSATPEVTATTEVAATNGTPEATATLVPTATATATLEPVATATTGPTSTPEPTATPYTLEGFQNTFDETQSRLAAIGLSEKDFLAFFEIQVLEKKLIEEITADVPRVDTQVWARHILVADEATAASVVERLNNGEDFAALALELSTDTGTAQNGGDLDWFGRGKMVAEFETAAFALEKSGDYTTTPVQSQFGFHIIQLIAKQDRPLTSDLYDAAKNKVYQDWLAAARETYGVEIFDTTWKQYVPAEPNFASVATDIVRTATAEAKNATATPKTTATPAQ
ncbi:MAG: peptidylprolyl isomerase [Chloroflexi bacterium]|nr:peptidylprolyl isomerase [Chloroflexota bacterium]